MYQEGSPYLDMVALTEYEQHLLELWYECGTVGQSTGGLTPLEWDQIIKWANQFFTESWIEMVEHPRHNPKHKRMYTAVPMTQCTLLDWELQLIRRLSQEYSSEYAQASSPNRECPKVVIAEDVSEDEALANAKAIGDAFKLMFGAQDTSVEKVQNK